MITPKNHQISFLLFPAPCSLLPIPYSRFPIPDSRFPIPYPTVFHNGNPYKVS
ncbi:MAG: hypothetical protein F6K57_34155, partial [Moorea sp. SIO4A5]|nr:hypothetical protein [Moorena sp. SIO4A5]